MIAFLNDKNTDYATGEADHDRNLFWDNGVHTIRNALAAANICAPIGVWDVHIRSILDMVVPENEFVNLAILGAEGLLDSVRADPCWRVARLHLDDVRRERGHAAGLLERLRELKAADGLEDRA